MSNLIQIFSAILISICLSTHFTITPTYATAYASKTHTQTNSSPHARTPLSPSTAIGSKSSLASKVIFQSPAMENVYKEFLVASKPLTLRKYNKNGKIKKTRKESKIYYIPIPPMPYRYIPGVGYDYQPMRINPILQETPMAHHSVVASTTETKKGAKKPQQQNAYGYGPIQQYFNNMGNNMNSKKKYQQEVKDNNGLTDVNSSTSSFITSTNSNSNKITQSESKLIRMNRGDYLFNGRPLRLQVAHAQSKNALTPQNLKSKLYFNKQIIY